MTDSITNTDNIIDSRDVEKRIAELEELIRADDAGELEEDDEVAGEDERAELKALLALRDEASGYASDWSHGVSLIHEDYFETYARDFARDIGAISDDDNWPATCIDWERAARELQMDYTSVEFDGITYWVRL